MHSFPLLKIRSSDAASSPDHASRDGEMSLCGQLATMRLGTYQRRKEIDCGRCWMLTEGWLESGNVAEGNVAEGSVAEGNVAEGSVAEGSVAEGSVATPEYDSVRGVFAIWAKDHEGRRWYLHANGGWSTYLAVACPHLCWYDKFETARDLITSLGYVMPTTAEPLAVRLAQDYTNHACFISYKAGTVLVRTTAGNYVTEGRTIGGECVSGFSLLRGLCEDISHPSHLSRLSSHTVTVDGSPAEITDGKVRCKRAIGCFEFAEAHGGKWSEDGLTWWIDGKTIQFKRTMEPQERDTDREAFEAWFATSGIDSGETQAKADAWTGWSAAARHLRHLGLWKPTEQ